jgi:hypothetical protein
MFWWQAQGIVSTDHAIRYRETGSMLLDAGIFTMPFISLLLVVLSFAPRVSGKFLKICLATDLLIAIAVFAFVKR